MKTKENTNITAEQIAALVTFAAANGRTWKSKLRSAWETGLYREFAGTEDSASLQLVRNNLGPSWLVRFHLPHATTPICNRLAADEDVTREVDQTTRLVDCCVADSDEDANEPDEDAITTSDDRNFYQYGKLVLTIGEDEDRDEALLRYMNREQFWPDCWSISDHGNAHRIDLTEAYAKVGESE